MNQIEKDRSINSLINKYSKYFAYALIGVTVAVIMLVEDISDNEAELIHNIKEFAAVTILLSVTLPLIGSFLNWSKKKWVYFMNAIGSDKKQSVHVFLWFIFLPLFLVLVFGFVQSLLGFDGGSSWSSWVIGLLFSAITFAIESFWDMAKKRRDLEQLNERLLRNHEISKYKALLNQLNPHFLFNSLNVLSVLVYKDAKSADKFIEELSKVYRYVLQLNEQILVPLKEELEFVNSYFYLQKIRFQDNLVFKSRIDTNSYEKFIPPLTLEVLIENAVKHNIISSQQPLNIKLYIENDYLVVENNLQPRENLEVTSSKVGLNNLKEKYHILEMPSPSFNIENDKFIAKVPLLTSEK